MPRNIAEFQIIGQVGKVDERENVTHASIAANYNRQVDGEWQSETYWNRVTCFGRAKEQAERAEVGDLVRVTGKIYRGPHCGQFFRSCSQGCSRKGLIE